MTKVRLITPEQYSVQRWKNGLGETREVARDSKEPFRWRVSLATLQTENQFSLFPGYERWIAFLGNSSVRLIHPSTRFERTIPAYEPVRFSGDVETRCTTSPGMQDFNLMVFKKQGRASLHSLKFSQGELVQFPLNGREHFLYLALGAIDLEDRNSQSELSLSQGQCSQVTRTNVQECLALRVKGNAPQNLVLWGTIHLK